MGTYIQDYPTHFDFRPDVARLVKKYESEFPWKTYINTYEYHPPVFGRKYEFVSFDVWGGGLDRNGRYMGYRGRALGPVLGDRIFRRIFNDPEDPPLLWIIWRGRMWSRAYGWGPAPSGPPDSDPQHLKHIHATFALDY